MTGNPQECFQSDAGNWHCRHKGDAYSFNTHRVLFEGKAYKVDFFWTEPINTKANKIKKGKKGYRPSNKKDRFICGMDGPFSTKGDAQAFINSIINGNDALKTEGKVGKLPPVPTGPVTPPPQPKKP